MHNKDNDNNNEQTRKNTESEQPEDKNQGTGAQGESTGFDTEVDFIPGETISEAEKQARLAQLEEEIKQTAESMADDPTTNKQPKAEQEAANSPEDAGAEINEDAIDDAVAKAQEDEQALLRARREAVRDDEGKFSNLEVADEETDSEQLLCMNCKTPLSGPYCHECGQPVRHFIRFFPRVLWEMVNEAFDFDSKIFRTIVPLLFRPGRLTMEYIAGRRARYVNPLRLYIVTSILFFISITVFSDFQDSIKVNDTSQGVTLGLEEGVKSRTTISDDTTADAPAENSAESEAGISQIEFDELTAAEQEERFARAQQIVESLKRERAEGVPIPEKLINKLEGAMADGIIQDAELDMFRISLSDLNVSTGDGGDWHPKDNPLKFNDWFGPETTQELNDYLWELKGKMAAVEEDPADFIEEVFNLIPQLMFILLPIFALLLKVVYIFKKRYYMEHLIVALHSHCFIFFSGIIILILSFLMDKFEHNALINGSLSWVMVAMGIWMPINIYLQQKRIYAQGYIMTTIKYIFVGISYQILMVITALAAMVLGLIAL